MNEDRKQFSRETGYISPLEKITDPARIANILKRLHQERALLTISLPGSQHLYTSALLKVDTEQGYLLLDELNPRIGHTQFMVAKKALVRARLSGVEVDFSTVLQGVGGESGIAFYQTSLPTLLKYQQRRAYYRVHVGAGHTVPVSIVRREGEAFQGELWDISAGGAGLRLSTTIHLPQPLTQGEILAGCQIHLNADTHISSGLEVRFLSHDEQHKVVRLGGRFVGLDKPQQKKVEQFIAGVDRELRKRAKQ